MSTVETIRLLLAYTAAVQSVFIITFVATRRPWWRRFTGRAIFAKSLALALILDTTVLAFWWQPPSWVGVAEFVLIAVGTTLNLAALIYERRTRD